MKHTHQKNRNINKYLIFIILFIIGNTLSGQNKFIINKLPIELRTGIIIYPITDTTFFVFKAENYLKLANLDSEPSIPIDSDIMVKFKQLSDTLKKAIKDSFTVIERVSIKDALIFPHNSLLIELFKERKIAILKKEETDYSLVDYYWRYKKRRKKHYQKSFEVIERKSKQEYFSQTWLYHPWYLDWYW